MDAVKKKMCFIQIFYCNPMLKLATKLIKVMRKKNVLTRIVRDEVHLLQLSSSMVCQIFEKLFKCMLEVIKCLCVVIKFKVNLPFNLSSSVFIYIHVLFLIYVYPDT